jgi:hypothetical protein
MTVYADVLTADRVRAAAGRELDLLVARHVMDWLIIGNGPDIDDRMTRFPCVVDHWNCCIAYHDVADEGRAWSPSADPADWWPVVEEMRRRGWQLLLHETVAGHWIVGFAPKAGGIGETCEGAALFATACRAALLALLVAEDV